MNQDWKSVRDNNTEQTRLAYESYADPQKYINAGRAHFLSRLDDAL